MWHDSLKDCLVAASQIHRDRLDLYMSTNEERRPLGRRVGRLARSFSPPNVRRTRRQVRRWLETHGLTLVLVSAMMVLAWMIAAH